MMVVTLVSASAWAQDLANGKDVNGTCAACHGANGEGGQAGEYPRLAGQPAAYLVAQLKSFQGRKRMNLPMFPYTEARELSETDMRDVAAYLSAIDLPAKPAVLPESATALEKLVAMEKVMVVARVEGDVESGKKAFRKRCAGCHGHTGEGRKGFPRLVGQYPNYLQRQVDTYRKAGRPHEADELADDVLTKVSAKDVQDIFAFLTAAQGADLAGEPDAGTARP